MAVNHDDDAMRRNLEHWRVLVRQLPLEELLSGPGQWEKAERLHYRRSCTIRTADAKALVADVEGETGSYTITLRHRDGEIESDCSCPSPYVPCKHVGALLFGLSDDPMAIVAGGPAVAGAAGRLDRTDRTHRNHGADRPAGSAGAGGDPTPAGEQWLSRFVGVPSSMYRVPGVDSGARFRPAFRLVAGPYSGSTFRTALMVEPVLVYLRQDGTDGRLDPYGGSRSRLSGGERTEQLLALLQSVPHRRLPALPLLGPDLVRDGAGRAVPDAAGRVAPDAADAAPAGVIDGADPGVELYLDRAGRLERERRAEFRRIERVRARWRIDPIHGTSIRYRIEAELDDGVGVRETVDDRRFQVDWDGASLWAVQKETGTVWYLPVRLPDEKTGSPGAISQDGPPGDDGRRRRHVAVVAGLLTDRFAKTVDEAREITEAARFPGIEVEPLPEEIARTTGTPVPVVRLQEVPIGPSPYPLSIALTYRYGSTEVELDSPVALVPDDGSSGPAEDGTGDDDDGEGGGEGPRAGERGTETARPRTILLRDTVRETELFDVLGEATFLALEHQDEEITLRLQRRNDRDLFPLTMQAFLIHGAPLLLDAGFEILVDRKRVSRAASTPRYRVVESDEEWLTIEAGLVEGERFLPLEGVEGVAGGHLLKAGGRYYLITSPEEIPFIHGSAGRERLSTGDLLGIGEIEDRLLDSAHPALGRYRELRDRLSRIERLEAVAVPSSFRGTLRPYQEHGLAWLWFLHTSDLGGCLADDMGLGKTIQTLALLALAREAGEMRRALVVAPVSTLGNWRDEATRFTPDFTSYIHAGADRHGMEDERSRADIIFVSYDILHRDRDLLVALEPDYLILDEAQAIKNPGSKRRAAVASVPARHRIALSGTPVENGVSELWSLLDVVTPGILGSHPVFRRRFAGVEEEDSALRERLRKTVRPLILRRTKGAVAPELPPKEEIVLRAEAGARQARFYEELRAHWEAEVTGVLGDPRERFRILEAMLRLRQAAILPALVDPRHAGIPGAKVDLLIERLGQIISEGNKALIFSQFLGVLDEVERRLLGSHDGTHRSGDRHRTSWSREQVFRLEGSTPQAERSSLIRSFQSAGGAAVFLISLKAGGTGINLTAADYVFLMDPWWNPAVEAQAVDRAHRIGRQGRVIAYRVITVGTIEEKILRLQEKKRSLADALVQGESTGLRELTPEEIGALFAATPD